MPAAGAIDASSRRAISSTSSPIDGRISANSSPPSRPATSLPVTPPERRRHQRQRAIAGQMSAGVVDALEVVQIERHHAHLGAFPLRPRELLAEPVVEGAVIEQAGQRIAVGAALEILVQLRVSNRHRGLAGDRLAEGDVASRPAPRRAVVGHLDQTHRPPLEHQRKLDHGLPSPQLEHLPVVRSQVGVRQPVLAPAPAAGQQGAGGRVVGERVLDLAARPRRLAVDRVRSGVDQQITRLVPQRDGALAGAIDAEHQLARERVQHLAGRERL